MGVIQWLFQRLSNFVIVVFGLWLLATLAGGIELATVGELLADGTTRVFLLVVLIFASLNSILAGWQIAGDYAHKFGINQNLMVGAGAIVSLVYLWFGVCILF